VTAGGSTLSRLAWSCSSNSSHEGTTRAGMSFFLRA
jgi:hypothetical protein